MRVFFCGNGPSALQIAQHLQARDDTTLIGGSIHSGVGARNADDIRAICGEPVINGDEINSPAAITMLRNLSPDVILSVHFGYILSKDVLELAGHALNLHPGFLPHGRGANPNVWAIIEESPAGVTLHYMDVQVDSGDILAQKEVLYDWTDTGETLYRRLLHAEFELFVEVWPYFLAGDLRRSPQKGVGSYHSRRELSSLDRLDLDEQMSVRDLLNRLRARTFSGYDGCYTETADGARTYFRLHGYSRPESGEPGRRS